LAQGSGAAPCRAARLAPLLPTLGTCFGWLRGWPTAASTSRRASTGRRASVGGRRNSACRIARRLSASDRHFLRLCLSGNSGSGSDSEAEFRSVASASSKDDFESVPDSPRSGLSASTCSDSMRGIFYAMHTDSDEDVEDSDAGEAAKLEFTMFDEDSDEDDNEDLNDVFSFDLERVAELLKNGVDKEELSKAIEEMLGENLESRLAAVGTTIVVEPPPSAPCPSLEQCRSLGLPGVEGRGSGVATPSLPGTLSGLMTPAVLTEDDVSPVPSAAEISARVYQVFSDIPEQRRRSSAMQHSRLAEAVNEATEERRQSLERACRDFCTAKPNPRRLSSEAVRRFVVNDCKRHRQSLLRAAEVLEVAGIGTEASRPQEDSATIQVKAEAAISQQLRLVQGAMKAARRRHRQCVAKVVCDMASGGVDTAGLPCQNVAYEKIQQIIAKAYARHQERHAQGGGQPRSGGGGGGTGSSSKHEEQQGSLGEALMRKGTLVALMHARSRDNRVHIGPAQDLSTQAKNQGRVAR